MKREWTASPGALTRLVAWLDAGVASDGGSYVAMHRRLAAYFARKGCRAPDDLADETLTRVTRRLEEEGELDGLPAQYCYIVARFVFLEQLRAESGVVPLGRETAAPIAEETREPLFACLDRCLDELAPDDRALILAYYADGHRDRIRSRRKLALHRGLTANALTIRACRLRDRLRRCVRRCTAP